jgi:hypothetical protein
MHKDDQEGGVGQQQLHVLPGTPAQEVGEL